VQWKTIAQVKITSVPDPTSGINAVSVIREHAGRRNFGILFRYRGNVNPKGGNGFNSGCHFVSPPI
jgi:hypothetical protein